MSAISDPRLEECRALLASVRYHEAAPLVDQLVATTDGTLLMEALGFQAQSRRVEGRYESAIQSLGQRRKLARELGDDNAQAWTLIDMGRLYILLNRYELALETLTEAAQLASTQHAIATLLSTLADV